MTRVAIILLTCLLSLGTFAQTTGEPGERDMNRWRTEMREYKHEFLVKQLELTPEQSAKFFELYDKMDDEIAALNMDVRAFERKIIEAPEGTVTDTEYDAATNALIELKGKEYELEKTYYPQFANILTKSQLFRLKKAERDFTTEIMRRHRKAPAGAKAHGNGGRQAK